MSSVSELASYAVWIPTLMLVIFRVAGIFITAPVLSSPTIPPQVKALMCVVVGLAVTARLAAPVPLPGNWLSLVMGVGGEMLIGATIGYFTSLLMVAVELGASQIGQQMGIALANVFNPMFEETTNVLDVMFHLTALAIFLAIGGHRTMLAGLLETFRTVPVLSFTVGSEALSAAVESMGAAFKLAITLAAPTLIALFLASVAMGLIQRTMPQLNILSAGFQIRILLAGVIVAVSLPAMIPLIEKGWSMLQSQMVRVFS